MATLIKGHNEETFSGLWMEKKLVDMLENDSNTGRKANYQQLPRKIYRLGKTNRLLSRHYALIRV
jgi:hypothetical protein